MKITTRFFMVRMKEARDMNKTKHAVAITLFASMQNGAQHYTKASQTKLRILLAKYHGIQIQKRWLFYCLADMESRGYIRRKERYRRESDGTLTQISSMITFTLAGVRYLVKKRIAGALALLKRMLKFFAGDDKRWPQEKDSGEQWTLETKNANKRRLKALLLNLA